MEKHFESKQEKNAALYLRALGEAIEDDDEIVGIENKDNAKEGEKEGQSPEEQFLNQFPGVSPLYTDMLNRRNNGNMVDESMSVGPRSCATFTVYCLMLMFTCILLFMRSNTVENYYSVSLIDNLYQDEFADKTNLEGVIEFLNTIGDELLANVTTNSDGSESVVVPQIRGLSILVGPIRLRTQKTKTKTTYGDDVYEYYSQYTSSTRYTGYIYTNSSCNQTAIDLGKELIFPNLKSKKLYRRVIYIKNE